MNISTRLFPGLFVAALSLNSLPAFADADHGCRLDGSYGYLYNGTSYTPLPVPLTQTGVFTIGENGKLNGEGILALYYADFHNAGPLWLLVHEVESRDKDAVTPSSNPCTGTISYYSTLTVIETSNQILVPEGTVLLNNAPRSNAYTISGPDNNTVDLISTSPGTIASGTAHKQDKPDKPDKPGKNK